MNSYNAQKTHQLYIANKHSFFMKNVEGHTPI